LSFDEFFLLQLGMLAYRHRFQQAEAQPLKADKELLELFLGSLSFSLTRAQQRAIHEIMDDLRGSHPMSRLLQGDVGSGKTAVAAAALWMAVGGGCQGAIMAPTEILAEQHARTFGAMFAALTIPRAGRPVQTALLTGSMRRSDRDAALAGLAAGQVDIVVGTHALIQGDVTFRNLAVAVVDEQHRFGVEQRGALRQKGIQPHVLVMSATPIPRSLALTIYGDLDVTVLDEMPAGRLPVKTKWLTSGQRERAYTFVRRQVEEGRQAFIVYPLVEERDASTEEPPVAVGEVRAAVEAHQWLQSEIFPDLRLGLLHGRMPGEEKDSVMRSFSAGDIDILVATSVVEVGIDVPNASVIMVEGADRFGLAQLHQFRGRVGRGQHPSFCILISDVIEGDSTRRLQALEDSNDGFALAQIDLDMRGPGDFFGTRQSGLPPLRTAQLGDLRTLEIARSAARKLFDADPDLSRPEHRDLAEQVAVFWAGAGDRS
jgi:ATP-dependent DNA helicase RecG